jgi:hypothetical protein
MTQHDEKLPIAIPFAELKGLAATVAQQMKGAGDPIPPHRPTRFFGGRAALFQRGIYDPVLVRFDSATAPRASAQEVGEQLATVAESL